MAIMKTRLTIIYTSACIILNTALVYGQHTLQGRIVDEKKEPLIYAQVVLLNPADSTLQFYDVSDNTGKYEITHIKPGEYLMQFTYMGKKTIYKHIRIPSKNDAYSGDTVMKNSDLPGEQVVVTAEYVPMEVKQDTVTFNARAFKTKPGAVVEDLLKKLPGVEVDNSGNVKALGEDVQKILVDGREFFDIDSKVATKNLPADAVSKINIFDKQSEDAEFSGINDGLLMRTINLELEKEHKTGFFGDGKAGAGTGDHYNTSGKLYRFSPRFQTAFLGMANNVNEFGYTGKGHGTWGHQINGLNTTCAGGINLSLSSKKPNRYYISYLGSSTRTELEETALKENFIGNGSYFQNTALISDSRDTPHKFNLGVRHTFNKSHKLTFNGNVSITSNNDESSTLTSTTRDHAVVNELDNITAASRQTTAASFSGSDIIKLNGGNTQLMTKGWIQYEENRSELSWVNTLSLFDPETVTQDHQFQDNIYESLSFQVNPGLVQKIRKLWYAEINLGLGSDDRTLNKKQGLFAQNDTYTDSMTAVFNTVETFAKPALSLRRSTAKSQMNVSLAGKIIRFDKVLDSSSVNDSRYVYILPSFHYTSQYQPGRRVSVRYSTSINMPGLNQLLPVTDTIDQLSLYKGNTDLTPEYSHNLSLQWSLFDAFSFTSFFARAGAAFIKDKVAASQTISEDYTMFVTPVNVDYDFNAWTNIHFSTPLRALGMKINASSNELFHNGISVINYEDNVQTMFSHAIDINLENRRKDKFHLVAGGSVTVNTVKFSVADNMNNRYFNTRVYTDFWFAPNDSWDLDAGAAVVNYNAESFREAVSIPVIEAGISYHFLRGRRATLRLKGYDLLNKYSSYQRISTVNYLMEKRRNVIGRYVILTLRIRSGK